MATPSLAHATVAQQKDHARRLRRVNRLKHSARELAHSLGHNLGAWWNSKHSPYREYGQCLACGAGITADCSTGLTGKASIETCTRILPGMERVLDPKAKPQLDLF